MNYTQRILKKIKSEAETAEMLSWKKSNLQDFGDFRSIEGISLQVAGKTFFIYQDEHVYNMFLVACLEEEAADHEKTIEDAIKDCQNTIGDAAIIPMPSQELLEEVGMTKPVEPVNEAKKSIKEVKEKVMDAIKKYFNDDPNMLEYVVVNSRKFDEDRTIIEVRAELSYSGMSELADVLNKVITKYDKDAYFEQVTGGIMQAVLEIASDESVNEAVTRDDLISGIRTNLSQIKNAIKDIETAMNWNSSAKLNAMDNEDLSMFAVNVGSFTASALRDLKNLYIAIVETKAESSESEL